MASDFTEYAQAVIYINSTLMLDCQNITVGNEQNDNEIYNFAGLAGKSLGTSKLKISVDSAVPKSGMQVSLMELSQDREVVEVEVFVGDKSLSSKGWIENVQFTSGIDNPASVSFEFSGKPAILK